MLREAVEQHLHYSITEITYFVQLHNKMVNIWLHVIKGTEKKNLKTILIPSNAYLHKTAVSRTFVERLGGDFTYLKVLPLHTLTSYENRGG